MNDHPKYEITNWRHEIKAYLTLTQIKRFVEILSPYVVKDPYYQSTKDIIVQTLYFEDLQESSYFQKINGNQDRVKYRAREYCNQITKTNTVFIETKRRSGFYISKSRSEIKKDLFLQLPNTPYYQLLDHIKDDSNLYWFYQNTFAGSFFPAVLTQYKRTTWQTKRSDQPWVRISFDTNVKYSRPEKFINGKGIFYPALPADTGIMEIKASQHIPFWLHKIIQNIPINFEPISKFALCYRQIKMLKGSPLYTYNRWK